MGITASVVVSDMLFNKGNLVANDAKKAIGLGPKKADGPQVGAPPQYDQTENETQARRAADRRRALYSNVGRSSTILTGPSGLGSAPLSDSQSTPKALLGL